MEIWQAIGNLSPGVAVGVVCLYFYNTMAIRYLEERKEMIQQVIAERDHWNEKLEKLIDRYDTRLAASITVGEKMYAEIHALRGRIQEFISMDGRRGGSGSGGND